MLWILGQGGSQLLFEVFLGVQKQNARRSGGRDRMSLVGYDPGFGLARAAQQYQ